MQDDSYVNHMLKYKKDNKEELVKKFEAKHGGGDKLNYCLQGPGS